MEYSTPSSASTPAKPRPHSSGMACASRMPAIEAICHDSQLTVAAPQKKGNCSGVFSGVLNRWLKATKITSPLK